MISSAEEFVSLRTSDVPELYRRAASEAATSAEVWLEVIRDYPDMRKWVAHNKTVPTEVLRALTGDPDPAVRWVVAAKRKLPEDVLVLLAGDSDEGVRERVARHRDTPREVLLLLAVDESHVVRETAELTLSSTQQPD